MEEEQFINQTPKNLTNNKFSPKGSEGSIQDETAGEIEDCYDEQSIQEQKKMEGKIPPLLIIAEDQIDMDYSQSHLDDFLKSQGAKNKS